MDIVFPLVVRIASAQDHVSNFSLLFHHAVHLLFSHLGLCSLYLLIPPSLSQKFPIVFLLSTLHTKAYLYVYALSYHSYKLLFSTYPTARFQVPVSGGFRCSQY